MSTLIILIVIAFILISWANLQLKKKKANMRGWVVDSDLDGKGKFYKSTSGIAAKPDVVVNLADRLQVIERKNSACRSKGPYKGDLMQVAAEMEVAGATEGLLIYSNGRTFRIRNTPELKEALGSVRDRIFKSRMSGIAPEATPSKGKCRNCDFNNECPDAAAA